MRAHGTHACYVWGPGPGAGEGCRCEPCRDAAAAYERERKRRVAPPYVAAGPVRRHLRWLSENGVGWKRAARTAGVPESTVWKLLYGDPQRGQKPSKRVRPATRDKLLAVRPGDAADGAYVDATRTWEHIDTLLSRGWTKAAISRAIGQGGRALQLGRRQVTARHARAIAALLDQPVPPRRSRHGEHPVPEPELDEVAARRERTGIEAGLDRYQLPTLELAPTVLRRGACRRPEIPTWLFFPDRGDTECVQRAKAVCQTCAVAQECLDFAVANNEVGVWGGTTKAERDRMSGRRAS